jgi:hypothetical protein
MISFKEVFLIVPKIFFINMSFAIIADMSPVLLDLKINLI